jgi:2-methylfumaryl-CoA isomerase
MRVVEASAFVAVPLAGMTLAQMGADVIRIDRPEGGLDYGRWPVTERGDSLFWAGLNKGKRSIAIDLTHPRAQEVLTEIVCAPGRDAGMFLTNLPMRGWASYDRLKERRPDMIAVSLLGDRHGRPQVDYTVNPAIGFPDATGPAGSRDPVAHVLPAWDCIAGNMVVSALLAAERHRLRTAEGQLVRLALKDVAAAMLGHLGIIGEVAVNGVSRERAGNALYGAYGQDFVCRDGERVMVVALTGRQWKSLLDATGSSEEIAALGQRLGLDLSKEGARWNARIEITEILAPWFAVHRLDEVSAALEQAGATWSVFRSFARALAEDPDLSTDNPMFELVHQPGIGKYLAPGLPLSFGTARRRSPQRAPMLGEHTEEILADVARLPEPEISALFDAKLVSQNCAETRIAS